jgi:hypothetical protein
VRGGVGKGEGDGGGGKGSPTRVVVRAPRRMPLGVWTVTQVPKYPCAACTIQVGPDLEARKGKGGGTLDVSTGEVRT